MVGLVGTWICSSEPAVLHSPVRFRRSAQTLEIVEKSIKSSCDVWDQSRRLFSYFRTNESLRATIRSVGPQLYLRNQSIYHLPVFRQWSNEGLYQLRFWYKSRHKRSSSRCRWSRPWHSRRFRWWWPDSYTHGSVRLALAPASSPMPVCGDNCRLLSFSAQQICTDTLVRSASVYVAALRDVFNRWRSDVISSGVHWLTIPTHCTSYQVCCETCTRHMQYFFYCKYGNSQWRLWGESEQKRY